jgi:GPH family glycoside/pentoside/hexuronide:cation symporter
MDVLMFMGFVVNKTHSKYGQSRPWILWMAIPYAVSAVLLFTVPHTATNIQLIYIFVTYNFTATVCYTALNLPYGSLSAMMTRSSRERDMLSIVRMALSPIGRIMAVTFTTPLVKLFGDDQAAWVKTMAIWAVLALLMLITCFKNCEEKVKIKVVKKEKIPVGKTFSALLKNQYFWAVLILWMMQNVITSITGTILPYYCKYILGNDTWMYSVLYMVETVTLIAATLCSPLLLKRLGKRNMSLIGCIGCLIGQFVFMVKPESFYWLLGCCIIRGICFAPLNSVIFGMLGDVVEFGQWKTHLRQESFIFAIGSVGTKLGNGITAAVLTQLLAFSGYVSKAGVTTQPQSVVNMIMNIYKVGPLIVWVTVVIILLLYRLDKKYPMIMKELEEREARGEL